MNAMDHIDNLKEKLLRLKTQNEKSFDKFVSTFAVDSCYKSIKIIKQMKMNKNLSPLGVSFFKHCMVLWCSVFPLLMFYLLHGH